MTSSRVLIPGLLESQEHPRQDLRFSSGGFFPQSAGRVSSFACRIREGITPVEILCRLRLNNPCFLYSYLLSEISFREPSYRSLAFICPPFVNSRVKNVKLWRRSCTCSKILELAMHSLVPLEVPEVRESSRGAVSCLCCFFEDFADDDTMTPALTPFLFFWWMFLLPFVVRAYNQFEKKRIWPTQSLTPMWQLQASIY